VPISIQKEDVGTSAPFALGRSTNTRQKEDVGTCANF
jgi:hypothetical protein